MNMNANSAKQQIILQEDHVLCYDVSYRMRAVFLVLMLFTVLLFGGNDVHSQDIPPQWPWRGIIVNAFTAKPEDVALLKKRIGINALRLELNARFLSEALHVTPRTAWKMTEEWADKMLDACRQQGVVGIISISQFPIDPFLKVNQESPEFWGEKKYLDEVLGLIGELSSHFKTRGRELVAYDILSEPLVRDGTSVQAPPSWTTFQANLIKAVRQHDKVRFIIVNPPPGGSPNAYRDFKPIQGDRLVYGAHMYLPHAYTHQGIQGRKLGYAYPGMVSWSYWDKRSLAQSLLHLRKFQLMHNVSVWIGEFSAARWAPGAEQYLLDLGSLFRSYDWGWAYQAYKEYHAWNPDYDTLFATDDPNDWRAHFVGETSVRWNTLKQLYGK